MTNKPFISAFSSKEGGAGKTGERLIQFAPHVMAAIASEFYVEAAKDFEHTVRVVLGGFLYVINGKKLRTFTVVFTVTQSNFQSVLCSAYNEERDWKTWFCK